MARGEPIYPIPRCMKTGEYELVFYSDGTDNALEELSNACKRETEIDTALNIASARKFYGRMRRGLLAFDADPVELQEVMSQSGLLELYPLTTSDLTRGYSGDPVAKPTTIVICLHHVKNITGTDLENKTKQDEKMKQARERFERGEHFEWQKK